MKEKSSFTIINDKGEELVCDVLFTFESEETHDNYIIYTDNKKDETGNVQVYASIYDPTNPNSELKEIKTDKEWKVIETILDTLQKEMKDKKTAGTE